MAKSDARQAVEDLVHHIKTVFKDYNRDARKKSWQAITSSEGDKVIQKIIDYPGVPTSGLPKLLRFKEWLCQL